MGVQVHPGTMAGGVTPICSSCALALCWDISEGEYLEDKAFWDAWVCKECNGGQPLRRTEFRKLKALAPGAPGRCYTGVGSRETPAQVLSVMRRLGEALGRAGFTLRSGGALGADAAFELGACEAPRAGLQVYLPWHGFNGNRSSLCSVSARAQEIARSVHPAWHRFSAAARKLHGRNAYQVLGLSLDSPSRFLVCWTADGCESVSTRSPRTGGTATAIVLAERHGVPVFNLGRPGRCAALAGLLHEYGVSIPDGVLREPNPSDFALSS